MSVHQKQPQILSDMFLELIIFRILLLSPFKILRNQQIVTTWQLKFYMFTFLFAYVTLRLYLCVLLVIKENFLQQLFLYNGKLWMYVELFSFAISALLFVCIIMNGLLTIKHQIKFYQDLNDFDIKLKENFDISIDRSRTRAINRWALIVSLTCNVGDIFYVWITFVPAISLDEKFTYFFTCYFSNTIGFILALQFVKCTQLCRERLAIIRKLLQSKYHFERIDNILNLYAHIRSLIFLINKFMGFVVLIKLAHDFTMGTSIMYLMFSYSYDDGIAELLQLISWFGQSITGTLLMTLLTEMLLTDVSNSEKKEVFLHFQSETSEITEADPR